MKTKKSKPKLKPKYNHMPVGSEETGDGLYGYANGGDFWNKAGQLGENMLKADANVAGSIVGYQPYTNSSFNGYGADTSRGLSNTFSSLDKQAAPMALNMVAPGSGALLKGVQNQIGQYNPKNNPNQTIYANGGVNKSMMLRGMPNAEVEKQEVMRNPDGSTDQVNGPSHANGGVPVNLENNTQIYSDRLKPQGSKKTFAKLAEKYKVNKEEKILSDDKADMTSKATAKLLYDLKQRKLGDLFQAQEQLKQDKLKNYASKLGVSLPQSKPDEPEAIDNPQEEMQEHAMGGRVTLGYQDPRIIGGIDMTNPSSVQYTNEFGHYEHANGGIHIKPSHVGRFTAYKERTGQTTEQALHSSNSHVRQMANFAKNASGWKHANGGLVQYGGVPPYETNGTFNSPDLADSLGWGNATNHEQSLPSINQTQINQSPVNYRDALAGTTNDTFTSLLPINNQDPSKFDSPDLSSLTQFGKQAGNFGAQNVGNLYDLYRTKFGKQYDHVNYGQLSPKYLDPTQALRDADVQNSVTRGQLRDATNGNSGAYLSNSIQAGATNSMNKARIRQSYEAANTGTYNQFLPINKDIEMKTTQDNLKSKARVEDIAASSIRNSGSNYGVSERDYKQGNVDQQTLNVIRNMLQDYNYDQVTGKWIHKDTGKQLGS
jgi:hypothetical protein